MGICLNRLVEVVLRVHTICFEQIYEKYQNFSKNFHFLVVKFSVYFNRHVFVMVGFVGRLFIYKSVVFGL